MRRALGLLVALGVAAIAVVAFIALAVHRVEDDLETRVRELVTDAGYPDATIDVDGRDVTVSGVDTAQVVELREAIADLDGVRTVDVNGFSGSGEPGLPGAEVVLTLDGTSVQVDGAVTGGQESDAIVAALNEAFPGAVEGAVITDFTLDAALSTDVVRSVEDLAAPLAASGATGTLTVSPDEVSGALTVSGADQGTAVRAALAALEATSTVEVTVAAPTAEPTVGPTGAPLPGPLGDPETAASMFDLVAAPVAFGVGSDVLGPDQVTVVEDLAAVLVAQPDVRVVLVGSVAPGESTNLAATRAAAVQQILVAGGVDAARVEIGEGTIAGSYVTITPSVMATP